MDSRPAKHPLDDPLFTMYVYPHGRRDLVIGAAVPSDIDVSFIGNIIDEPGYLIGMGLDYHLVRRLGVHDTYHGSIHIHNVAVVVGPDVIKPNLLSRGFKAGRRCVVEIVKEELLAFFVHETEYD